VNDGLFKNLIKSKTKMSFCDFIREFKFDLIDFGSVSSRFPVNGHKGIDRP
jgi:hypothetical protein